MLCTLPASLYDDAVALWERVELTRPWNDPVADLHRSLDGPSSTVLAWVSSDGALLGTAMVGGDGHRAWIYYVAVDPEAQGQGIGRALVAGAEQWAVEHGLPKLMLMVRTTNARVIGFYEALGYTVNEVATLGKVLTFLQETE